MAVTLNEIAKYAEVSIPTASQILSNKGQLYNSKTRERVLEAAKKLGYRPNAYARSVVTKKFGAVALLLSSDKRRSYLPGSRLDGIVDAIEQQNCYVSIMKLPDEKLCEEGFLPKALREWMSDGLLVNYNAHIPFKLVRLIQNYNIPTVWLDTKRKSDCVHSADIEASKLAGEYLLKLGHRRIGYAHYSIPRRRLDKPIHFSEVDRFSGAKEILSKAGLELQLYVDDENIPRNERVEYSKRWLKNPNRPTAVLTYASTTALPIIIAAMQLGLRIPQDLSIITFAEEHIANESGIGITSLVVSEYDVGKAVADMMLRKIETPERKFSPYRVHRTLEIGHTTELL